MMQPTAGLSSMPTAAAVAAAAVTAKITAMDAQQLIMVSTVFTVNTRYLKHWSLKVQTIKKNS